MSENKILIKHNKHRIHPCPNEQKLELLKLIIAENSAKRLLIVSCEENEDLKELASKKVTVMADKELYNSKDTDCELLISYDLPKVSLVYISRLGRAKQGAIILLDASEQKELYPIETLIGKVIRIEKIEGFEHGDLKLTIAKERPTAEYKFKTELEKQEAKEKADQWKKKEKPQNTYLGKDEKGKGIFTGKTGDRNHKFDGTPKNKWDAPKPKGKKITIKARKPKED